MQLLPLHHPGVVESDNFIQRFIDSQAGVFLASLTHTAGALLFTAGIALYLYVAHLIRKASAQKAMPDLGLLNYAHGFTLAGIALNGLGGISRLKQGDHPGLEMLGESLWVQVLLVKHLFLTVGVGLAVYLTWRTRGFGRRARADMPRLEKESPRMIAFALGSFFTILVATAFGVVASMATIPVPGGEDINNMEGEDNGGVAFGVVEGPFSHDGTISGAQMVSGGAPMVGDTTGAQSTNSYQLTVPEGADTIEAELEWSTEQAVLTLAAIDPNGTAKGESTVSGTTITHKVSGTDVVPGVWTIEVRAVTAVAEEYTVTMQALYTGGANVITDMVEIQPGRAIEINMEGLKPGDSFDFTWVLMEGTTPIYFDIHLHTLDGEVKFYGETYTELEGNYTHESEENDGASLEWKNEGSEPVMVHYEVWGAFQVKDIVEFDA